MLSVEMYDNSERVDKRKKSDRKERKTIAYIT